MPWRLGPRRQHCVFFFNDTATTEIYTLSLHDALPIYRGPRGDRKSAGRRAQGWRCPAHDGGRRCESIWRRLSEEGTAARGEQRDLSPFYRLPASRTVRPMRRRAGRQLLLPAVVSLLLVALGLSGLLLLRTHPRFAVNRVVLEGVPEARRSEAEELTDGWIGRPLLFLDLDQPVAELSKRSWVASATARRIVPDTITVRVVARPPVALVARVDKDGELWTIDRGGSFISPYTGH